MQASQGGGAKAALAGCERDLHPIVGLQHHVVGLVIQCHRQGRRVFPSGCLTRSITDLPFRGEKNNKTLTGFEREVKVAPEWVLKKLLNRTGYCCDFKMCDMCSSSLRFPLPFWSNSRESITFGLQWTWKLKRRKLWRTGRVLLQWLNAVVKCGHKVRALWHVICVTHFIFKKAKKSKKCPHTSSCHSPTRDRVRDGVV